MNKSCLALFFFFLDFLKNPEIYNLQCFGFQSVTSGRIDEPPDIHRTNYNDKDEMIMGIVMTVWQVYQCFNTKLIFSGCIILITTF